MAEQGGGGPSLVPFGGEGARPLVQGYGDGGFRISDRRIEGGVLVTPDTVRAWTVTRPEDITADSLLPLLAEAGPLDVLLIGTGASLQPLPAEVRAALKERGIAADPMDTGAACRTIGLLMAEGRAAGAALIPV